MSSLERFQAYADAFEQTLADDNWQRLEEYFTPDASYDPGDGTVAVGREQVLTRLTDGVNGLDRRFDSRALSASEPKLDGDTVSLSWQLTLSKDDAPDLVLSGAEHATFKDGAISKMQDVFDEGTGESLTAWMTAHGDLLAS